MLTSYSDASFVSSEYGRELSGARTRAVDVEATSDDPPDRVAAWLATVSDAALRGLDFQLLRDLLAIEDEPTRWRDIADTVAQHAEDLVRVGLFDQAWQLAERVAARRPTELPTRRRRPRAAPRALRPRRDDEARAPRTCGTPTTTAVPSGSSGSATRSDRPMIAPLAEVLAAEQDARSRRRLRDILVGFGAAGRESVQQLMNATELGGAAHGALPAARVRRIGGAARAAAAPDRHRAARPAGGRSRRSC